MRSPFRSAWKEFYGEVPWEADYLKDQGARESESEFHKLTVVDLNGSNRKDSPVLSSSLLLDE
jgi:hypothetical protein